MTPFRQKELSNYSEQTTLALPRSQVDLRNPTKEAWLYLSWTLSRKAKEWLGYPPRTETEVDDVLILLLQFARHQTSIETKRHSVLGGDASVSSFLSIIRNGFTTAKQELIA
jgi:hypothetical protein